MRRVRTAALEALLANSFDSIDASLRVLGPIGASTDPAAMALFAESAGRLVEDSAATVGVTAEDGDGFAVMAAVGDGPAVGERLAGEREALASRARELDRGELVSDLITDAGETRLVLARPVGGTRAVIYQESSVDPGRPAPPTPESPFRELRVALYASPAPATRWSGRSRRASPGCSSSEAW